VTETLAAGDGAEVVSAYGLSGFPFGAVVAGLFVIVLLRAQATYWLGRGLTAGTIRSGFAARLGRRLSGARLERAIGYVNRWGPIAVTLCFLTVGVQTVVNLAAGLTRMPFGRYTLAMIPGCVAWAFIYATVGLTAFYAGVAAAAGSPWAIAGLVAAVVVLAILLLLRRRRSAARQTAAA
jgi:membrane protein DedA with SNARE-associated domain